MMLFKQKKDVIGIDIGSSSVKLVQLREAKGGYHLVTLGMSLLPPEAIVDNAIMDSQTIIEVLQNLVESLKVKTKNVATSVSGHSVIIRKIQLPIMTEEEMEASIQWEAEQYIPFEISEVNLDFQILGGDPNDASQMDVILVAAKKDFVSDYVSMLRECGFNPVIMDIDCFSVQNVFESNYGIEAEIVALIDMGASSMNVNILKDGMSVFTRDIQVGGSAYNEEIQKRLGLNHEDAEKVKLGEEVDDVDPQTVAAILDDATDALTQEVQRSIDFFSATSSDEKVGKVYITGGVAKIAAVRESLANRLNVDVEVMDPWRQIGYSEKDFDPEYLQAVGPVFTVAAGLAMRRMGDK
ncbi:MAG TPA: type IV pilus assembly protein PilM [Desulfuromonadales bacterium]|nr:type IV pilus assembly protein PilM [Desulfuromonadales bacterium]